MKVYNPSEVTIQFAGLTISSGFAEGEFLTAEPVSDTVNEVVGTDGEVCASVNNDSRWLVTIKLMQSSDENVKLSTLWNLRKRGPGSLGVGPFTLRDANTGETLAASDAYVKRAPDISFDAQATSREWQILLTNGELSYGV